jgi:hypothetical protein
MLSTVLGSQESLVTECLRPGLSPTVPGRAGIVQVRTTSVWTIYRTYVQVRATLVCLLRITKDCNLIQASYTRVFFSL